MLSLMLLSLAKPLLSRILILSSAVFFFGPGKNANGTPAGLFDAFDLIRDIVGRRASLHVTSVSHVLTPDYSGSSYLCNCTDLFGAERKYHCYSGWPNRFRGLHPVECLRQSLRCLILR